MSIYYFLYKGQGNKPEEDVENIRQTIGVEIINDLLPRILIIKVEQEQAKDQLKAFIDWKLQEPQIVDITDQLYVKDIFNSPLDLKLVK